MKSAIEYISEQVNISLVEEQELSPKQKEYRDFFGNALKKFKVDSPADFKSDADKKEFFNWVSDNWKG